MMSQAVDTVLFVTIAFAGTLDFSVIINMILTQYVVKILIAIVDTPLVYVLVSQVRRYQVKLSDN